LTAIGQPRLTLDELKNLSAQERDAMVHPPKSVERSMRALQQQAKQEVADALVDSTLLLEEKQDAYKKVLDAGNPRIQGVPTEFMSRIAGFSSTSIPSYHKPMSANTVMWRLQERLIALEKMLNGEIETVRPLDTKRVQDVHDTLLDLLNNQLLPLIGRYTETNDEAALDAANSLLQSYWFGTPLQRRAVELVFNRSPNDNPASNEMGLVQIDKDRTRTNDDGITGISQSLEDAMS